MTNFLPNGIGATSGDSLALAKPLLLSGNVWYVSYVRGIDAGGSAGLNREKPLKTLAQAVTNSADNDIIVLLSDHVEPISVTVTLSKRLTLVGEGSSGGNPVAQLYQSADVLMLDLTAAGVELRNIKFSEPTVACVNYRVKVNQTDQKMSGCRFELGPNTDGFALFMQSGTSDRFTLKSTTFISIATSMTNQPFAGFGSGGAANDLTMDGVVFSDGTVGCSNLWIWDMSGFAITRLRATNISMLLGADAKLQSATTGYVHVGTATGGGKVTW